ncbi:MAG: hypothetical protein IJW21_01425, partial [Clostridia bacterium]|nr:hypothetical protein [Clostridia bacterium]
MVNAEKFLEAFGNIDDEFIEEAMNYTMKKKFNFKPIIAAAACLVLAVTAYPMAKYVGGLTTQQTHVEKIGVNGNYTAYESGLHAGDIELNANHNVELVINTGGEFVTDEAKKGTTKTIEF